MKLTLTCILFLAFIIPVQGVQNKSIEDNQESWEITSTPYYKLHYQKEFKKDAQKVKGYLNKLGAFINGNDLQ